jgi:hypothetical protein
MNSLTIALPVIAVLALFALLSLAVLIDPRDPALQREQPARRPAARRHPRARVHLYPPPHAYVPDSAHAFQPPDRERQMHTQTGGRWLSILLVMLMLGGAFAVAVTPALAADVLTGTVDSELGLNLRAGPGLAHRVLLVLKDDEALELVGRSQSSQWLEVRLPESKLGGWVFAAYVQTRGDLGALRVTEASGGPTDDRPPAAQAYSLYVTIADNVATVYLENYPANADVIVKLGRASGAADLLVAEGQTDVGGSAQITFAMPAKWADGKVVVERNLVLSAATVEGKLSHSASILYIK